jgi:hypothetical protein
VVRVKISSLSLIRHAAMVSLCTSRPQQLRCTRMAILLCHWRRRLHWKNLPCELSGWRYHFAVPTASSSTWFAGSTNHTIAIIRARSHSGESHCALARQTFSCFVVTEISVRLTWLRQLTIRVRLLHLFQEHSPPSLLRVPLKSRHHRQCPLLAE